MNSCKFIFIVLSLATHYSVEPVEAVLFKEGDFAKRLIAYEDTERFLKVMDRYDKGYGENWIVMPDGNDQPIYAKIDKNNVSSTTSRTELSSDNLKQTVKLFLYTLEHSEAAEIEYDSLHQIKLNSSSPIRMICHGWMANFNSSVVQNIKDVYLAEKYDNVIAVDWSEISSAFFYPYAAISTHSVGNHLGHVIDKLVGMHGIQYKNIHLIGHSLGAHVVGFAGSAAKEKVGRITGLDPALPGFQYMQGPEGRLDASDATFVDVIHTCSGLLGMSIPVGHVDFYPNGGSPFQPGCCDDILVRQQSCSHSRSHQYFAESIKKQSEFLAVKCRDWEQFKRKHCDQIFNLMGEHVSKNITGTFYLKTNDEYPFYKGRDGTLY